MGGGVPRERRHSVAARIGLGKLRRFSRRSSMPRVVLHVLRSVGVIVAAWFLASCSASPVASAPSSAILFEGGRLIVGDDNPPIESSAFLVEDRKITKVGRKGEVEAPAGAARVDLTGKTVMPAIVDAHGHLGFLDQNTGLLSKANFTREN